MRLTVRSIAPPATTAAAAGPDPLAAAAGIGERLVRDAVWYRAQCNWVGLERDDEHGVAAPACGSPRARPGARRRQRGRRALPRAAACGDGRWRGAPHGARRDRSGARADRPGRRRARPAGCTTGGSASPTPRRAVVSCSATSACCDAPRRSPADAGRRAPTRPGARTSPAERRAPSSGCSRSRACSTTSASSRARRDSPTSSCERRGAVARAGRGRRPARRRRTGSAASRTARPALRRRCSSCSRSAAIGAIAKRRSRRCATSVTGLTRRGQLAGPARHRAPRAARLVPAAIRHARGATARPASRSPGCVPGSCSATSSTAARPRSPSRRRRRASSASCSRMARTSRCATGSPATPTYCCSAPPRCPATRARTRRSPGAPGEIGIGRYAASVDGWPSGAAGGAPPGLLSGHAGIGLFYLRLHDSTVPSALLVVPGA